MSDKQQMQADGGSGNAHQPDGVNNAPGDGGSPGAYPNGVKPDKRAGGFFGHGGQTEQAYSGPEKDGEQPNAATR
ncbi:hypothetical protein [Sphingomonas sp.]|uniref:hypothetical protein n=1 Tax=Sphingomonas sp. TaxID=28214 RepID=UPI002ED9A6B1